MRYYNFGNYYLAGIHAGIQALHVVGEIWSRYGCDSLQAKIGLDWAKNHKTAVLLNAGNAAGVAAVFSLFEKWEKEGMTLPYAKFHEDEESLNGALTATGIVLPEKYYNAMGEYRSTAMYKGEEAQAKFFASLATVGFASWEIELVGALSGYGLAS
jgi:hypothetical protein